MPDTLKAQHVSRLTAGVALYSDMGRVLASIVDDTCGWHDTITGHSTARSSPSGGGRAAIRRRATTGAAARGTRCWWSWPSTDSAQRDLVANVNFFTKVAIGEDGELAFVSGHSAAGRRASRCASSSTRWLC